MTLDEMVIASDVETEYEGRKNRDWHPVGKFDNAGRWHPSEQEECDCCRYIRSPSRAYPYSLMTHCRSKRHVKALFQKLSKI